MPTLVPQRRPGSLQLAASVLVQHCQRSMDQTPVWVPRHFQHFQVKSQRCKQLQMCASLCQNNSCHMVTGYLFQLFFCPAPLMQATSQHKSSTSLLSLFCYIDVECLNRHFLLLNTLSVCPIKNLIYWTTLSRLFVPSQTHLPGKLIITMSIFST